MRWQVAGTGCGGERQLWGSAAVPARGVTSADGYPAGTEHPPPGTHPGLPAALARGWLCSVAGFSQIWQRLEVLGRCWEKGREEAGKLQAGLSPY